jgi:hypothetical protein
MTFLQLVNDVLIRMRESEVATVQSSNYSKLIGKFVNDAKRRVEDAYNWNSLGQTVTVTCVSGTSSYVLTGTSGRFKIIDVINDTTNYELRNAPITWLNKQFLIANAQTGSPEFYGFNGVDSNGDTKVDLFPIPNSTDLIRFSMFLPQAALSDDADVLTIPSEAVIAGAYALAVAERGEDQGLDASEASQLYRLTLSDAIAIESSRYIENDSWTPV